MTDAPLDPGRDQNKDDEQWLSPGVADVAAASLSS
jgi:hypothetical protein